MCVGGEDVIIKLSQIIALHSGLQPDALTVPGQAVCYEELKTLSKFYPCGIQISWGLTAFLVLFQAQHPANILGRAGAFESLLDQVLGSCITF